MKLRREPEESVICNGKADHGYDQARNAAALEYGFFGLSSHLNLLSSNMRVSPEAVNGNRTN